MAEILGARSSIQINRLTTGWTWYVSVHAADNSIEQLRDAKEKALLIERELRDVLPEPRKKAKTEPAEAPF